MAVTMRRMRYVNFAIILFAVVLLLKAGDTRRELAPY